MRRPVGWLHLASGAAHLRLGRRGRHRPSSASAEPPPAPYRTSSSPWPPPSGGMTPIDLSGMPHGHLQQEAQRALWKVLLRQAQSGLLSRPSLQLAYNLPMALPDFSGDNAYTLSWNSLVFASMAISEFILLNFPSPFGEGLGVRLTDLPCNPLGN